MWHIWVCRQSKFEAIERFIEKDVLEVKKVFFPTIVKEFKRGDKVITKRVPLYSGYLWLEYEDLDHKVYWKLSKNPFITTYVGTSLDVPEIENMIKKEEWNTLNKKVIIGDEIEVGVGPLKGFKGVVQAINGNKVTIKVNVFSREVNAHFPSDDLEILDR